MGHECRCEQTERTNHTIGLPRCFPSGCLSDLSFGCVVCLRPGGAGLTGWSQTGPADRLATHLSERILPPTPPHAPTCSSHASVRWLHESPSRSGG